MTPARLNELSCPTCGQASWIIDSDYRGMDGVMLPYGQREYSCRHCSSTGPGWTLIQQSPPEFMLQPHHMYPMTNADFDHWLAILEANFPDYPLPGRFRKRLRRTYSRRSAPNRTNGQ